MRPGRPVGCGCAGVEVLRQVWVQQYWKDSRGDLAWRGQVSRDRQSRHGRRRRSPQESDQHRTICTGAVVRDRDRQPARSRKPDTAARKERDQKAEWVGYKDHQSETCDDSGPNVIVHVVTRPAPDQDIDAVDEIHAGWPPAA